MIEQLADTRSPAFGFRVSGPLTTADISAITPALDRFLAAEKHPIGLLADLSTMHGASWSARLAELHFLRVHAARIARFAVISADEWEQLRETVLTATAHLQAETRYYLPTEIHHAWHWVRMRHPDTSMPVRIIQPGDGLFRDYTPEYMGV